MTETEELRVDLNNHVALCHSEFKAANERHECMMRQLSNLIVTVEDNTEEIKKLNKETRDMRSFWSDMTGAIKFSQRLTKVGAFLFKWGVLATGLKILWDYAAAFYKSHM